MKKSKRPTISAELRGDVWEKYNGKIFEAPCYVCQKTISIRNYEAGHIISHKNEGKTELKNLRPICSGCNKSMHTMNMDEYIKKYGYASKLLNEEIPKYEKINVDNTADEIYKYAISFSRSISELIELIHFNENKPENHNIYVANIQDNYAFVYYEDGWKKKDINEILQKLFDKNTKILCQKYDELKNELNESTHDIFRKIPSYINDESFINIVKNDIKCTLYRNKNIVENKMKNVEENNRKELLVQ